MTEPVNLTNCDREPIHIPGSIQPHGCLLACDVSAARVVRHSINAGEMLGAKVALNEASLTEVVGNEAAHTLRNALATSKEGSRPALLFDAEMGSGRRFDVALHRYKSNAIIEFEPSDAQSNPLQLAREMIGRIRDIDSVDKLINTTSRLVAAMLGYDRVMIYRFEQDGSGKVVSETKRGDLESFLGQYFPASDIPQQARALYMRNTIRIISDSSGAKVAIEPQVDVSGEPLDLSFAHLRSVSPIHLEYLRNMGVGASMSISVIVEGRLWGLIACHHYSPKQLPMAQRVAVEMFGDFFSLHLQALKQSRAVAVAARARQSLDRFLRTASQFQNIDELLSENLPDFMTLMPCDGIGLWMNGRWISQGSAPAADAVPALVRLASATGEGRVWATHSLSQKFPDAEPYRESASGLLSVPLSQTPRDFLFFFRKELEQTLNWAGNPSKTYETGAFGDRLTPRKSFAIWKETVHGQSQPWTDADRETAEAVRAAIVEIVLRHNELVEDERAKASVRQRMLNEELNHRVKNILAVIKSLVGHPAQDGKPLRDYVETLKGRIQALSYAHDQVVRGDGGGLLAELLAAELSPYRGQSAAIDLTGPKIWLDARTFSVLALVLHELATNAAKYGALSKTGGRLRVSWSQDEMGDCVIEWREAGGPPVSPPSRSGFGTALIDRSIPYDLGGSTSVEYAVDGVRAQLRIPARYVAAAEQPKAAEAAGIKPTEISGDTPSIDGLSVLLVEDQMLIAMDVEAGLIEQGAGRVVPANSVAEAMRQLQKFRPDAAVLDVNLGAETSIPVAEELLRLRVPFVFATGYGEGGIIPPEFRAVPIVRKPYDASSVVAALASLLPRQT